MDERADLDEKNSNATSPLHGHWYASVLLCFCCLSVQVFAREIERIMHLISQKWAVVLIPFTLHCTQWSDWTMCWYWLSLEKSQVYVYFHRALLVGLWLFSTKGYPAACTYIYICTGGPEYIELFISNAYIYIRMYSMYPCSAVQVSPGPWDVWLFTFCCTHGDSTLGHKRLVSVCTAAAHLYRNELKWVTQYIVVSVGNKFISNLFLELTISLWLPQSRDSWYNYVIMYNYGTYVINL